MRNVRWSSTLAINRNRLGLGMRWVIPTTASTRSESRSKRSLKVYNWMSRNAEAHKVLGRDMMLIGRFDAAKVEFQQGIRYDPKSAELHYNLGKLYSIQDNWAQAKTCFERAIALDSSFMEAYDGLGLALESLGDKNEATVQYQKAIDLAEQRHAKFSAAHVNMSALYNNSGRSEESSGVCAARAGGKSTERSCAVSNGQSLRAGWSD